MPPLTAESGSIETGGCEVSFTAEKYRTGVSRFAGRDGEVAGCGCVQGCTLQRLIVASDNFLFASVTSTPVVSASSCSDTSGTEAISVMS